jgi:hypothetical protein
MSERELIPLTSYDQVPRGMTEDEAHEFWSTHAITEEYLATMPPASDEDFPPAGQSRTYVAVHLDREAFRRARQLARRRGIGVAALLDELVEQALAAEEERLHATGS